MCPGRLSTPARSRAAGPARRPTGWLNPERAAGTRGARDGARAEKGAPNPRVLQYVAHASGPHLDAPAEPQALALVRQRQADAALARRAERPGELGPGALAEQALRRKAQAQPGAGRVAGAE